MLKNRIALHLFSVNMLPRDLRETTVYLEVESISPLPSLSTTSVVLPSQNAQLSVPGSGFVNSVFQLNPNYSTQEVVEKLTNIFIDYEPGSGFTRDKNNAQNIVLSTEGEMSYELEQVTLIIQINSEYTHCKLIAVGENGRQVITLDTQIIDLIFLGTPTN